MTQNKNPTTQNLDRLLAIFAGKRILFWAIVAVAIHAVIITGTSLTYVRDRWIDPEGAAQRKAAIEAEKKRLEKEAAAAAAPALAGLTNAAAVVSDVDATNATNAADTTTEKTTEPGADSSVIPPDRADTPMVKRITETAKPEEMPTLGNDLGISIEDTRVR